MSDEEGEDLVQQCQWTANDIYGTPEYYGYIHKYTKGCYTTTRADTTTCLEETHKEKD